MELVGFDRPDNRSRGVRDPLLLQAAVWDSGGLPVCLLAMDSLGLTKDRADRLRDVAAGELGVGRERVMACFSHTHAAPNAALEARYFDGVVEQARDCARRAREGLVPVEAAWGLGEAEIGVNRRDPQGPLDRRIGVLEAVEEGTGKPRLLLLRLTAHANVLLSDNLLASADFLGAVRTALARERGCPVMVTQGAAGNVRPRFRHSEARLFEERPREAAARLLAPGVAERLSRESDEALGRMAEEVRACVDGVRKGLSHAPIRRLDAFSLRLACAADVPGRERALRIAEEARREAGIDGAAWLAEAERFRQAGIRRQEGEMEIQFLALGDGCLCGTAEEAMCETSLEVSRKAGDGLLLFGGYTNGCGGYLPTAAEYDKGGFETLWSNLIYFPYQGRIMPWNRETATNAAEAAARRWARFLEEEKARQRRPADLDTEVRP